MPNSAEIESHRCWPLAVHEAAHAVLGVLFGLRLKRIAIDLRTWQGGATFESGFPPNEWRRDLLVSLAGELAQKRADPTGWSLYNGVGSLRSADDQWKAWLAVSRFNHLQDIQEEERIAASRMAEGQRVSALFVNRLWPNITALAERLLDADGLLEGDSIEIYLAGEFPAKTRAYIVGGYEFPSRPPQGE